MLSDIRELIEYPLKHPEVGPGFGCGGWSRGSCVECLYYRYCCCCCCYLY